MRPFLSRKRGYTLMEVLIASVLFILILAGLINIFVAGKKYILHSRARMSGGELGRLFLDPLQAQVRQDEWASNCLGTGSGCGPVSQEIDNMDYTATYDVNSFPDSEVRRVTAEIKWTEPSPTK